MTFDHSWEKIKTAVEAKNFDLAKTLVEQQTDWRKRKETWYRLGNLFFQYKDHEAAREAWQKSKNLGRLVASSNQQIQYIPLALWQVIGASIFLILFLFSLVLLLFPREPDPMQMLMSMLRNQQGQQRSAWDEWWDSGRSQITKPYYGQMGDVAPFLRDQWNHFWKGEQEQTNDSRQALVEQELQKWMNRELSNGRVSRTPVDHYLIAGKGFFNLREFEKALNVFYEGLMHSQTPGKIGTFYQEIGTTYYYQGYVLQPDGLAKYDLPLVRKSVEAYEQAIRYIQDPYLYGNIGWGYYLLKEYDHAVESGLRALAMQPQLNYVRMNLGITYLRMGKYAETFRAYRDVLEYTPDPFEYEGAIRDLKELSREFPQRYPFIDFILGYLFFQQSRYAQAREHFSTFQNSAFPVYAWKRKAVFLMKSMEATTD